MKLQREHVIAARGLLGLSQVDLAKAAGLSEMTVHFFESGRTEPKDETLFRLQAALEQRGIEFFNGDGIGVRYNPAKALIPRGQ